MPTQSGGMNIDQLYHALSGKIDDSEKAEYVDMEITRKIKIACEKIINAESELTQLDSVVGDGDCAWR